MMTDSISRATGLPRSLDYPEATVGDLCAFAAGAYDDRVAVRDGERTLSYREVHDLACRIAQGLRARGVRDRDVVMLHQPNSLWFLPSYYGILLAGAVASPTNPLHPAASLRAQLQETGAVAALSHPAHATVLDEARQGTRLSTLVVVPETAMAPGGADPVPDALSLDELVAGQPAERPHSDVGPDDLAHLVYTGGTTGVPKAVRGQHRHVVANITQMACWRSAHVLAADGEGGLTLTALPQAEGAGVVPGVSSTVVVSPMFHVHALVNTGFLFVCGTSAVLAGRFEADAMLDLIERERITYVTGSPTMWHSLVTAADRGRARDVSCLRVVSSGAAPIDGPTLAGLGRLFPTAMVLEGYGLTEATCLVSIVPSVRGAVHKPGSVGVPVPDTEVQIRSGNPEDRPLGPGERGQLWVRGPQVADGYLDRPDATARQFVDGWLDTGDIAYVDDEGYVFICDRAKDMLIYKGYNVYPRELEDLLVAHPAVDSAAVVGREAGALGQEPVAFVVPAAGQTIDREELATTLMGHVAEQVLPYKKLRGVHLVEQLPSNPAGKILKTELRRRLDA